MEGYEKSRQSNAHCNRRALLLSLLVTPLCLERASGSGAPLLFGLTPVFLTNDLELLTQLKSYLVRKCGVAVELVQRRTYEEITTLLLSGQLDAAWICGYPFAQFETDLALVAVPEWRGKPLYQSYIIVPESRDVQTIDELQGDLHAFSDPNSNSGFLVTAALLAERKQKPETFFKKAIFTYGHRNVVRAVASGLVQSGSVDGYVWEVMAELEPELTNRTKILRKSEELGFPPVACLREKKNDARVSVIRKALIDMKDDVGGQSILRLLRLDGFAEEPDSLFDAIAAKMALIKNTKT